MRVEVGFAPIAVLLLGCPGEDTDEQNDTDGEAFAPESFVGEVHYRQTVNEVVLCDADVAVSGARYAGDCPQCDFSFTVDESSITRDDGPACELSPFVTLVPSADQPELWLGFSSDFWYGVTEVGAAVLVGSSYSFEYDGTSYDYPGPYWQPSFSNASGAVVGLEDGTLTWALKVSGVEYQENYWTYCEPYTVAGSGEPSEGDAAEGSVTCANGTVDVWSFDGEAGGTATISMDSTVEATAFDAGFDVVDPNGCLLGWGDEELPCAYGSYRCPAVTVATPVAGTYSIVAYAYLGLCDADTADYELRVTDGETPSLTLTHHDVVYGGEVPTEMALSGTVTVD